MSQVWFTTAVLAHYLGVDPKHAARLCRTGKIPARWDGKCWRVRESDAAGYLAWRMGGRRAVVPKTDWPPSYDGILFDDPCPVPCPFLPLDGKDCLDPDADCYDPRLRGKQSNLGNGKRWAVPSSSD